MTSLLSLITRGRGAMRAACPIVCAAILLLSPVTGHGVTAAAPLPEEPLPWPGGERATLALPDAIWAPLLDAVDRRGRPLGYTLAEMQEYGRDLHLMRSIASLFQDARQIPVFSGRVAESLIAASGSPAGLVQQAFLLTDISAGRMLPMPDSTAWGLPGVDDGADPMDVLRSLAVPGESIPAELGHLSPRGLRLVARICSGAAEAMTWLRLSHDREFLTRACREIPAGSGDSAENGAASGDPAEEALPSPEALYRLATDPWTQSRYGQYAVPHRMSFLALDYIDREFLAFGSVIFLTHLERALKEYEYATAGASEGGFPGCRFMTAVGEVAVGGAADDHHSRPASILVDFGGNDTYTGRHGVPLSLDHPIGLVLDLSGDDVYTGGDLPAALACGLFGLGAIIDLDGDDVYQCSESGLGSAWHGVGLLYDRAGNDTYTINSHHGQGHGCAGVGILADLSGNDSYTCGHAAQGYGMTLGAGILLDVEGDDRYLARDDGNPSALYLGQSVSMAQGVGQGRRADLGDGHSLAGGFGLLVDGSGDDTYHASAWSQGAGYWWGVGFLEDLAGDDAYRNGKYSSGAAAHFAIGCQVDLSGNDEYNRGNDQAVNQYQGHARDGAIGISIDGDGDDFYHLRSHCGGSADLSSIGLFWDRRGNDVYECRYSPPDDPNGWNDTPPLGSSTVYAPFRSFRDKLDAHGIFLDTGGVDDYTWLDAPGEPLTDRTRTASGPAGNPDHDDEAATQGLTPVRNNAAWLTHRGPGSWGLGLDGEWYPASRE